MSYFENKVVWITGASSGIGEALAYTFAKQKAKLVLSARREDELNRVKAACGLPDADIMVLPLDVAQIDLVEGAKQKVIARFGQIDILVNNAGLSHWSKLKDTSLDVIKTIMNVNFFGGVALTKAVLPDMLKRKQGNIVVISSILGKIVTPKQGAYNASKHALMGFYDTLRAETMEGVPINKDNSMIANGLDPLYVSEQILKAIQANKEEILLAGFKEKFGVWIKRFAPGIYSRFISNNKLV